MRAIESYPYNEKDISSFKDIHFGKNRPVVYLLEGRQEAYIGQTVNLHHRSKQHWKKQDRRKLKTLHLVTDEEFNKSAALDIESWLIQYMSADGRYKLQNGNGGLRNHNYFDRAKYETKFQEIREQLRNMGIVNKTLSDIRNSDLFKYSPYKSLTIDQLETAKDIINTIEQGTNRTLLVHGKPGTGKTILAVYLVKYLLYQEKTNHLDVGLVIPMVSLRKTIKKVFGNIHGLKSSMVIGPNDVIKKNYDILIVDEAHRLSRRKNLTNMGSFDTVNKKLGLGQQGNQLDWVLNSSRFQILFYDENQSVRPSDVRNTEFASLNTKEFQLSTQMRVEGGERYIEAINNLFYPEQEVVNDFKGYDLQFIDSLEAIHKKIKGKESQHSLSRLVAGYARKWKSKKDKNAFDFDMDGYKLKRNSTPHNRVNSANAINEVGCIHTIQGYDLNYVGVIIGPEIGFDRDTNSIIIRKNRYHDFNGKRGLEDEGELEWYIINIYKTLLTRGIKGTYIYIVDQDLREWLKSRLRNNK